MDQLAISDDCVDLGNYALARRRSSEQRPHIADPDEKVFFRITHTGLGRHKLFEKGSVTTHDLGLHVLPTIEVQSEVGPVVLEISFGGNVTATKLATWLSEKSVTEQDLRNHMMVWKAKPGQGLAQSSMCIDRVNLHSHFPADDHSVCRTLLNAFVQAHAFGDSDGGSDHVYVPPQEEQNERVLNMMVDSGFIFAHGIGYRFLDEK